ncbi:MAG TPA: hypothetical protein VGZ47_11280 [Gemmataceae bacterium]|jgi:hypothetical protein|nr:hypothetical protein [Gemmataceae bacterium]
MYPLAACAVTYLANRTMQTVTFTCVYCNNLMAVSTEFLGHQVRCPTCNQIVQAPAVAPAPILATPPSSPSLEELSIESPRQETHESIFGETHDEDLFGTPPPKIEIPPDGPTGSPSANGSSSTQFAAYPPAAAAEAPLIPEVNSGFANPLIDNPAPATVTPAFVATGDNPFEDAPVSSPAPPAADPFFHDVAGSAANTAPAVPGEIWAAEQPAQDSGKPAQQLTVRRPTETLESQKSHKMYLMILAPYAVLMTLVAAYYAFMYFSGQKEHPLEFVPDIGGEYPPANKGGPTKKVEKMPAPDLNLPNNLRVHLGTTLRIGDLEVTPERIELKKVAVMEKLKGKTPAPMSSPECLVLKLRMKNVSADAWYYPTDPYFDRYFDKEPRLVEDKSRRDALPGITTKDGKKDSATHPYDFIEVGKKRYYGGRIDYPYAKQKGADTIERRYVEGQENDDRPLSPGEERTTVMCAFPSNELLSDVQSAKDTMTWRVLLRRGIVEYKGREKAVCSVIGVEFTATDVARR